MKLFWVFLDLDSDIEGSPFPPEPFMGKYFSKLVYAEDTGKISGTTGIGVSDESIPYDCGRMIATFILTISGFKCLDLT